ncbi:MAG: hypothetical protein HOI29_07625 [Planctomycetes bacterium]|nr:hypothetical protein [Planctomycetota bacterium]
MSEVVKVQYGASLAVSLFSTQILRGVAVVPSSRVHLPDPLAGSASPPVTICGRHSSTVWGAVVPQEEPAARTHQQQDQRPLNHLAVAEEP